MSGICRSMHWRAEMAPRTHSSSMVFQAGRANRSRIASVTSNGVTVPSKSQMTEYGPAAKSGNWNHVLLLREGVIGMHVETPGCFPKISKQRATAPEIRGMPLLPL